MKLSSRLELALAALLTLSTGCADGVRPEPSEPAASAGTAHIYVSRADGSGVVRLRQGESPVWSPDGRKIAFTARAASGEDIFVMNADGSNPTQLTRTGTGSHHLQWSPDGRKIAFASGPFGYRSYNVMVSVVNADGSDEKRLTRGFAPAWSPDGSKLAFTEPRDPVTNASNLVVMSADGTNRSQPTVFLEWASAARWSPDGTRIVFMHDLYYDEVVSVMSADGSDQVDLVQGTSPAWSPDGRKIAFKTSDPIRMIAVMNADGTQQTKLSTELGSAPRWSPGGDRIAYDTDYGATRIVPVNGDAGSVLIYSAYSAAWSPDGASIAFVRVGPE